MKSKALLLLVVLSQVQCHQVIFTAPPGSTIGCSANPEAVAAFNGVSVISCLLQEEIGTPVADGTVVQFFTNLGRVPEQGKTNDGVVRINFQADGRSGIATVQISSGGGTLPPVSSSSTNTLPGSSSTVTPVRGVSASGASSTAALAGVMANTTVRVTVGNASARQIRISADPPRITEGRTSQITATVFDEFGNPVAGVPVFFAIGNSTIVSPSPTPTPTATPTGTPTPTPTAPPATTPPDGGAGTESLDSQGSPVFTDTNGRATDTLRTRWPREGRQRTVTISAAVPVGGNLSATTTVIIN
jgi:hypothetical protein